MASVFDVAVYILKETGEMTAMKLEKLVYYSQSWSLVWDEQPLFSSRIEAWANGPVCPDLYAAHAGQFRVSKATFPTGKVSYLNKTQKETISVVIGHYGKHDANYLSKLTHLEAPWLDARDGLEAGVRSQVEIKHSAMAEYYGSL